MRKKKLILKNVTNDFIKNIRAFLKKQNKKGGRKKEKKRKTRRKSKKRKEKQKEGGKKEKNKEKTSLKLFIHQRNCYVFTFINC